jgi:putative N-acetylmannosamine-6-phosphate epimerase
MFMAAMARAAEQGGAGGIRANGADDIAAIRAVTDLPVIGICKRWDEGFPVYITPDFETASSVVAAGANVVALDATARKRKGDPVDRLIARIRSELDVAVMADIATIEQALAAETWGAEYVASTLAGYTDDAPATEGPDLDLLAAMTRQCRAKVVAEGRYSTPELVARAFGLGAHAVVVGTAITDPCSITRRFAAAAPR